jgi:POT family proton-dependent oligopeptide transporter
MTDVAAQSGKQWFGHPRGLATLFMTEMWERFSYYGMRALLILYMTAAHVDGGLEFDVVKAGAIYGLYTAMVYLVGLPGGWIADRFLGHRRSVLVGGILIAAGQFALATPSMVTFYLGLALIVIGTGLLKPNISVMVGQLYTAEDARRDSGFTIFYMGINIGAFVAPLICSSLGERVDWHLGFAAAGVGMVFGLIQYMVTGHHLGEAGLHPTRPEDPREAARQARRLWGGLGIVFGTVGLILVLNLLGVFHITAVGLSNAFGAILAIVTVVFFGWLFIGGKWTPVERNRLVVIVIFFLAASIFWSAFEQAGSTLNIFARDNTNRLLLGWEFPAGWFQSLNPLFIIALAPLYSILWIRLARKKKEPSSPAKFAFGLILLGLGFLVMVAAASAARAGYQVSSAWLFFTYLLHTMGELTLSPVGLSTVTKLAPARVTGLMMGVWFLAAAVGNFVGGRVAGLIESFPLTGIFLTITAVGVGSGLLMAVFVKPIRKLMGGVH